MLWERRAQRLGELPFEAYPSLSIDEKPNNISTFRIRFEGGV